MRCRSTEVNVPSPLLISGCILSRTNCQWPSKVMYSFPPTCILLRLKTDRQFKILLVLQWSPQAKWLPMLNNLPGKRMIPFPVVQDMLRQPHWNQSPEYRVGESASGVPGKGRFKLLGFSDNVINRIGKSRATSTRKHYKSQWDLFVTWATEQKLNPLDASLPLLTSFMDYLFRVRNVSVCTILNYKSAIAFYSKSKVGYDVPENDTVVSDLIRSFKRDRPFPTKHVVEWASI